MCVCPQGMYLFYYILFCCVSFLFYAVLFIIWYWETRNKNKGRVRVHWGPVVRGGSAVRQQRQLMGVAM